MQGGKLAVEFLFPYLAIVQRVQSSSVGNESSSVLGKTSKTNKTGETASEVPDHWEGLEGLPEKQQHNIFNSCDH